MVQPAADALPDAEDTTRTEGHTWFGHPRQLARLFATEMWERFGYYGIRALLVLYLTQWFLFDDQTAGGLYGGFVGMVYLTPLFGGLIADRVLGSKKSVKLGAIVMCLGYLGLCFGGEQAKPTFSYAGHTYPVRATTGTDGKEVRSVVTPRGTYAIQGNADGSIALAGSDGSVLPQTIGKGEFESGGQRDPFFVTLMLISMGLVVTGNGLFKPNISTIVGNLYAVGDRRRDAGFTIFYMGINTGSILSQLLAPLFARWFGWWAGFGLVGGGMFIAFLLFQFDGGRLNGYGEEPAGVTSRAKIISYAAVLLGVPLAFLLLQNTVTAAHAAAAAAASGGGFLGYFLGLPVLGKLLFSFWIASAVLIPLWALKVGTRAEFQMMLVATILTLLSTAFWTLFEMAGSALTLFAERSVDRHILGFEMPGGSVQAFNPMFVVAFAAVMAAAWVWLGRRGWEPSIPVKFAIALVLVGAGYLLLVLGSRFADGQYKVALIWLIGLYLCHSIGELCLSPVGLSMITKLSIARVVGLMMGVWFLSTSMANYVGGLLTQLMSVSTVGGEVTNPKLALDTYIGTFQTIGIAAIVIGVLLFLVSPVLRRWMHGVQ